MKRIQPTSRTITDTAVGLLPDKKVRSPAAGTLSTLFNPKTFLAKVGKGKTTSEISKQQVIFSQGDAADAVFYIQAGRVKLTVLSQQGKEAVVGVLEYGSFFGEGCLVGQRVCMATVTTLDASTIARSQKAAMVRVLPRRAQLLRAVHGLSAGSQCAYPIRLKLIISSIRQRSAWRGFFCCWLTMGKRASRSRSFRRSARTRSLTWSAPRALA